MQLWTLSDVQEVPGGVKQDATLDNGTRGELTSPRGSITNVYAECNTLLTSTMCFMFLQFQLGEQVLIFNAYFVLSLLSSD